MEVKLDSVYFFSAVTFASAVDRLHCSKINISIR